MIDFNQTFDWHPKYKQFVISENELILISETENYCLSGEKYKEFIKYIDGEKNINQIIKEISDFYRCALFIQGIKSLIKSEILQVKKQDNLYSLNKRKQQLPEFFIINEKIKVYNFSELISNEILQVFLNLKFPFSIVFVDDYLDPRLEKLNLKYLKSKRSFILIKPTGEKPLIGPLFSAKDNRPCWKCLSDQMIANQPVKKWIQQKKGYKYIQTPTFFETEKFDKEWFISLLFQVSQQEDTCFEINNYSKSFLKHKVNHRPQCSVCGDISLMKTQIQMPIVLKDTFKIAGLDGGSRSVKPENTVQNLKKFISPLTGVITDLTLISEESNTNISIYKSSFFSTPPHYYKSVSEDLFVQFSLGKGVADVQSKVSALCESIERYSAQFKGDEYFLQATPDLLDSRFYLPNQLAPFSEKQYKEFETENSYLNSKNHAVKRYLTDEPLHWVPTWSLLKEEKVYLPFTYCFSNAPLEDNSYVRWNSNGAAAGNTIEEAILQGFYEVIERDATAIWWYNKTVRQEIEIQGLDEDDLQKVNYTLSKEWDYWLLDITTNFGIPVVAAIAQHKDTKEFCFGFGCHLNIKTASSRALTELCQLIPIRHQDDAPFDFKAIKEESFLKGYKKRKMADFLNFESKNIKQDVLFCASKVEQFGYETLVINYSRPEIPIKTVKVIIPGLCFIWPQLGNERLYKASLELDLSQKGILTENELNTMGLYV
ncbi:TOMM precursor leader peptide-binding protein [Aquimarina sp. MMG015]|nr:MULTISPECIES: TOMM precursor leader peptide-binding protein [unclassified Aquimarina]AXT56701.1 hypothetical protein D1815_13425 [Aquimarina sp. AD1]MBQ4802720.1 TOMM precursor leader peptide-binding protein [Aquimarina sp. MMG015]